MISRLETPSLIPLKGAIWLYFILLLIEGALRKWILPGLSDILLIVRDPAVLIIYVLAIQARVFPLRPSLIALGMIAFASTVFSVFGDAPVVVTLFGLRTNYLHLSLVFIMMQVLRRDDVIRFGRALFITSIPIFGLMLMQFQAAPDSWLNAGAGGGLNGQIRGALGKIRPPGPFSFIDGIVCYFSLVAVFVYYGWSKPGVFRHWLLLPVTIVTVLAVPISISRSLLMGMLVVLSFGVVSSLRDMKNAYRILIPLLLACLCLLTIKKTIYLEAFTTRWDESINAGQGSFNSNVLDRILSSYTDPAALLAEAPLLGHGIGTGTLAGARLMTGKVSFLLSESELSRIILELGPLLGAAFIGWRVWLALCLIFGGWRNYLATNDALSWLIAGATVLNVATGQWGSSTQLGFAVFGAGLALAARNVPAEPAAVASDQEEATVIA